MDFLEGAQSALARSVSAEIRARLAATRGSGKALAAEVGVSQNYLATRLRDEKPFTLDDVEAIVRAISPDEDAHAFITDAEAHHGERVWIESDDIAQGTAARLASISASDWTNDERMFAAEHSAAMRKHSPRDCVPAASDPPDGVGNGESDPDFDE